MKSDVAFSPSVKAVQTERGSRAAYASRDFDSEITDELRAFLADVDSAYLATVNAEGQPYVQHRGGAPGFISAVSDDEIGWIEERGNRQFVTHGNLRDNDRVCLLLMDYASKSRVKVWGHARLDSDRFILKVTAWDANCPKNIPHMVRVDDVAPVIEKMKARIAELERALADER